MQDLLSVLFYTKGKKIDKQGKVPIYMRITYNGQRAEISTMRKIDLSKWNSKGNNVVGQSSEAKQINRTLDVMKNRVHEIHQKFLSSKKSINASLIKRAYLG